MKTMIKTLFCLSLMLVSFVTLANSKTVHSNSAKLPVPKVSETLQYTYQYVDVLGSKMAYIEDGKQHQEIVLFVHGNPTSSYLWRNILPYVAKSHHAVAVDLIGMGQSDKPDINYGFAEQYQYFSAFIQTLQAKKITLVGHDWGAALVWEYTRLNPHKVKQLAFMEGVLPPGFPVASYAAMQTEMADMFKAFNDPQQGPQLVVEDNIFVEQVLPSFVNRALGEVAMEAYRQPFSKKRDRKPVLAWPRQVPIAKQPLSTFNTLTNIGKFMQQVQIPILLVYANPGVVTPPAAVAWYQNTIPNLDTAFVGQGLHFIQEDQPQAIGRSISDWLGKPRMK